jgi:hypothetical protein
MSGGMPGLNRTGLLNSAAEQEEFLRQGGFTGIGMTDDSKGPSTLNFVLIIMGRQFFFILLTFPEP